MASMCPELDQSELIIMAFTPFVNGVI